MVLFSVAIGIGNIWIFVNNCNIGLLTKIHWDVDGTEGLEMDRWYLVVANHQSWTDILVLQKVFYRKIPFYKFFLKRAVLGTLPGLGLVGIGLSLPGTFIFSPERY